LRYLFLLIVLLGSFTSNTTKPALGETEMPAFHYLALGDSYTIGESVPDWERWPNQLAASLAAEGIPIEVKIIARTGWTVDELWQGIQENPPEGTYDLVTLLIGVNDQFRGYPVDGYREKFRLMLGKAIEYAGGNAEKIIVLSIPDWGSTPFAADKNAQSVSHQIDLFNAVNFEETKNAHGHYIDITEISRMAGSDAGLIAGDGLHPTGRMYSLWAEKVLTLAREILQ
jgi:lysophospholipase L1-like esterase